MDRCRCDEYKKAVDNLRFYTPGCYRPDYIDNYDRTGYGVVWIKKPIDTFDLTFEKPKASKLWRPEEIPENQLSEDSRKILKMWCPYMTPIYGKKAIKY